MKFVYIAAGGAIGALLRYTITNLPHRYFETVFPWGTLLVNLLGSLIIGLLWGASEQTTLPSTVRTFLFIGILGAFTTFSTYGLETLNLFRDGETRLALINILANNVGAIALCTLGFLASRYLVGLFK